MPEIPVGDVLRKIDKLPSWLKWILNLVRGVRITKGGTTIVLDEKHGSGATPPRTGLDQPAPFNPPKSGGRWPL